MGCLFWQYSQIDNSVFRSKRVICTLLKTKEIYIVFHCARGLIDFRTMEMIHCFLFHSRNTLQKQGDVFDFQLHTGNTLYNEVFCSQLACRRKEVNSKESIYQYCFPIPLRATRIVEKYFAWATQENIYLSARPLLMM